MGWWWGGRALNKDAKTEALEMIGQKSNLCACHISRTSFNSWTGWVPYQIKILHKSTSQFLNIKQPHDQQSADPSNRSAVQRTMCLKANGPVSLQVGVQITRKLTNLLLHDRLEPYTKVQLYLASLSSKRNI